MDKLDERLMIGALVVLIAILALIIIAGCGSIRNCNSYDPERDWDACFSQEQNWDDGDDFAEYDEEEEEYGQIINSVMGER